MLAEIVPVLLFDIQPEVLRRFLDIAEGEIAVLV